MERKLKLVVKPATVAYRNLVEAAAACRDAERVFVTLLSQHSATAVYPSPELTEVAADMRIDLSKMSELKLTELNTAAARYREARSRDECSKGLEALTALRTALTVAARPPAHEMLTKGRQRSS